MSLDTDGDANHPEISKNPANGDGIHVDKAKNFRRLADQAAKDAEAATDPQARKSYQDVARNWLRLAAIAERRIGVEPT